MSYSCKNCGTVIMEDDTNVCSSCSRQKTRQEIESLKTNWRMDPCWDIEDTEGFEEHKQELLEYRQICEKSWTERKKTLEEIEKAQFLKQLGIASADQIDEKLLIFLQALEKRVTGLEIENKFLQGQVYNK